MELARLAFIAQIAFGWHDQYAQWMGRRPILSRTDQVAYFEMINKLDSEQYIGFYELASISFWLLLLLVMSSLETSNTILGSTLDSSLIFLHVHASLKGVLVHSVGFSTAVTVNDCWYLYISQLRPFPSASSLHFQCDYSVCTCTTTFS